MAAALVLLLAVLGYAAEVGDSTSFCGSRAWDGLKTCVTERAVLAEVPRDAVGPPVRRFGVDWGHLYGPPDWRRFSSVAERLADHDGAER